MTKRLLGNWLLPVLALLHTGCATQPAEESLAVATPYATYCDSYLVYDMCVHDIDGDGEADVMYFEDTREVFMADSTYIADPRDNLSPHRCIQQMDNAVQQTSTRLLTIDEETGALEKTRLKSKLMLVYMHFYNDIQSCMNGNTVARGESDGDGFGDQDAWYEDDIQTP